MSLLLYNLGFLLLAPAIAAWLFVRLFLQRRSRGGWRERLGFAPKNLSDQCPRIWMHAVSAGEMVAAAPVARALQRLRPDASIVVSTITPAGLAQARRLIREAQAVFFFPIDFWPFVRRALARVRPTVFVTVETELWPNFLHAASRAGIATAIVNGRFSDRTVRRLAGSARLLRPLYARALRRVGRLAMQTPADGERAVALGADRARVIICGNTKFDQEIATPPLGEQEALRQAFGLQPGQPLWIAGSTHAGEEEQVLAAWKSLLAELPDLALMLAPRHIERAAAVESLCREIAPGHPLVFRTRLRIADCGLRIANCRLRIANCGLGTAFTRHAAPGTGVPTRSVGRGSEATMDLLDFADSGLYDVVTAAEGPQGRLPLTEEMLREWPSGDLFGLSQSAGMGWDPARLTGKQFLILSTQGGVRAPDGRPIALGYHTGHWEVGLLVQAAAEALSGLGGVPFAAYCSDPCDGRSQGTTGMMDSLPYRNDAALIFRRLIRSLPTRRGVLGVATCDKGLPAMIMALAAMRDLPCVLVPGGVTLPPAQGEDAGTVQTIGARFAHGMISLEEAAEMGCRACATPGGGCQFLGTAATAQVVGEALGLSLPHSALAPSGQPIWLDTARRSARALARLEAEGIRSRDILTPEAIHNAMAVHAAFGGSTNLLLHLPAFAHAAGLPRPAVADWIEVNRQVPRLVDVLPNGPTNHVTVRVFLAGGVPEVMLHLRRLGLLHEAALTVAGEPWGRVLDAWERSERRARLRETLRRRDGVDPDEVIMDPERARDRGLTSTVTFPRGNLAPEGAVIKSTAIDPRVVDADGVYRKTGPARVFLRERDAVAAIKSRGDDRIRPGDVMVLICRGPMGAGMEEIYQVTSALKHLPFGREVAVLTDARFSGVSTGACIGHIGPEALAGGPIGKVIEEDVIRIVIDRSRLEGSVDLVGHGDLIFGPEEGARLLAARPPRPDLAPDPDLPDDTRLWAALSQAGGGAWGGCVYDPDAILALIEAGRQALGQR